MLMTEQTKGVYVIAATPFAEDGSIDYASADTLVENYIEQGVSGITILGMMGEAVKLSSEESEQFMRHMIGRVDGRVPVLVGVSDFGTISLEKLSKAAWMQGPQVSWLHQFQDSTQKKSSITILHRRSRHLVPKSPFVIRITHRPREYTFPCRASIV